MSIRGFRRFAAPAILILGMAHSAFAQSVACDLDASGSVNVVDVNRAVSMALGTTTCTAQVEGANVCTIITVQRVVNSALGQPCVTYSSTTRSVSVTWVPSVSVGVVGYNIYRRSTPTGTRTKLNTVPATGTTFTDTTVALNSTYYYSMTSTDANGNESAESNQAIAVIPAS